jgi:hypothetical protein
VLLRANEPRKHTFRIYGKRKNNSFWKIGSNFSKWGVEPFLNLAGPNFRPKKLGTKLSGEGRGVQKKLDPIFSKWIIFPDFSLSSDTTNVVIAEGILYKFFRVPLDEWTTKTYFLGLGKRKNNSASKRQKFSKSALKGSSPSWIWPDQTSDPKSWEQNCHGRGEVQKSWPFFFSK